RQKREAALLDRLSQLGQRNAAARQMLEQGFALLAGIAVDAVEQAMRLPVDARFAPEQAPHRARGHRAPRRGPGQGASQAAGRTVVGSRGLTLGLVVHRSSDQSSENLSPDGGGPIALPTKQRLRNLARARLIAGPAPPMAPGRV